VLFQLTLQKEKTTAAKWRSKITPLVTVIDRFLNYCGSGVEA
jgi:hypothetical protein